MKYITATEAATRLRISESRVCRLAKAGRIVGARLVGRVWQIPDTLEVRPGTRGPKPRRDNEKEEV